ncbi:MAG: hypothetical protein O3B64_00255 [bacterium]|nr:hypothetical protein [bacterium]MDA1024552.1 hypothetical protein [bacterium]
MPDLKTALLEGGELVISGRTVAPRHVDLIELESGEEMIWIHDEDIWISIDVASDEVLFMTEFETEIDASEDMQVHQGVEFELTFETKGNVVDEDGEVQDSMLFRDYASEDGEIMRIAEFSVSGEVIMGVGKSVPEEEVQFSD